MNKLYVICPRHHGYTFYKHMAEWFKRGFNDGFEIEFFNIKEETMSTGMRGGYPVASGYMGYVDGKYQLFETEEAYNEFMKEREEN